MCTKCQNMHLLYLLVQKADRPEVQGGSADIPWPGVCANVSTDCLPPSFYDSKCSQHRYQACPTLTLTRVVGECPEVHDFFAMVLHARVFSLGKPDDQWSGQHMLCFLLSTLFSSKLLAKMALWHVGPDCLS